MTSGSMPQCAVERSLRVIIDQSSFHGPLGNTTIKIPGTYKISVTYEPIGSFLSATTTKQFEIIKSPNDNQDEPVFTDTSLFNNNPETVKRIFDYCN